MDRITPEVFVFSILFTLLMAALLGMLWAWAWALGRIWKGLPIVADDRARPLKPAPWGSLTVLSLVFLYVGVNISVARIYAAATGRHLPRVAKAAENQVGAREPGKAIDQPKNAEKAPGPGEAAADGQSKDVQAGLQGKDPEAPPEQSLAELMFQFAVSNGLLLVLVPAFVRFTSGAGLADLGLHRQEWPRQMGIGVRAAMLMTPPVCAIQFLAIHIWRSQTHPVEQMVLEKLTPGVTILAVLSTMVLAPLIEELLFRGILQRWLGRFVEDRPLPTATIPENGWSATLESENNSFLWDSEYTPPKSTSIDPGSELLDSGHQPAEQPSSRSSNLPILLTSILFAAMHLPQWPAPIAILLLSMALGTVYQRTGSLLASITMHATFNGINTMLLLLAAIGHHIQAPIQPAALAFSASSVLTDFLSVMSLR
jgi:membrane protease YdiL (CAAX protease family)